MKDYNIKQNKDGMFEKSTERKNHSPFDIKKSEFHGRIVAAALIVFLFSGIILVLANHEYLESLIARIL